jgi:hypothetical protein
MCQIYLGVKLDKRKVVGLKMHLFLVNLNFFCGTGEVGALLPVVGTLLQFSPDEVNLYSH